jgi:hypothetical protein
MKNEPHILLQKITAIQQGGKGALLGGAPFIAPKSALSLPRPSYATHNVSVLTKYELRDEEKGAVDPPSTFKKRNMYENYCYENGWTIKVDNKGQNASLGEYTKRKINDLLWADNMDTSKVVAWWTFNKICKEGCTKIQVRPPCNNTCGECTIFRNIFWYKTAQQQQHTTSDEVQ